MERERGDDDDDDDVQALKREVELLKALLHQERKKSNSTGVSQRDVSPARPSSPTKPMPADRFSRASTSIVKAPPTHDSEKGSERSPRRNIALGSVSERGKSIRWNSSGGGDGQTASAAAARERALYLQHVPVDTKRGKWWLKDRQILSRNAPSPFDDCVAIKVRETWLWSGRTVVVDKIITCPNALDDSDEFDSLGGERGACEDEGRSYEERLTARGSPVSKPGELYLDSKQLAQEFMQLSKVASGVVSEKTTTSEPLQAASACVEHQMSVAAAQVVAAQQQEQKQQEHNERQHAEDQQSPAAGQAPPPATE